MRSFLANRILQFRFRSFQQKRAERVAYLKKSTVELKKKLALKVSATGEEYVMIFLVLFSKKKVLEGM